MKNELKGKLKDYIYALQQWEEKYPELEVVLTSFLEPSDAKEFELHITIEPKAIV